MTSKNLKVRIEQSIRMVEGLTEQQILILCNNVNTVIADATQEQMTMNVSDEVKRFFKTIGLLLREGSIWLGQDLKFKDINFTQTADKKVTYTEGWLLIRIKCVYPLYREKLIQQNKKPLDLGTLERHLKNSFAFDMKQSAVSHRFKLLQNPTNALCFRQKDLVELYDIDLMEN